MNDWERYEEYDVMMRSQYYDPIDYLIYYHQYQEK